jgi:hypothetical protein
MSLPDMLIQAVDDLREVDNWWPQVVEDRLGGTPLRWRENDRRQMDPATGERTPLRASDKCEDCYGDLAQMFGSARRFCPVCQARPRPTAPAVTYPAPVPLGESPAPLRLAAMEALADLDTAITALEATICEGLGQTPLVEEPVRQVFPRPTGHPLTDCQGCSIHPTPSGPPPPLVILRLRRVIRTIGSGVLPDHLANPVAREAASMRRTLDGALGRREQVRHLKGVPCTICGCYTLVAFLDREQIICTANTPGADPVCECNLPDCGCHRGLRHVFPRCECGRGGACMCTWEWLGLVNEATAALGASA